jgi:hypothetical protein
VASRRIQQSFGGALKSDEIKSAMEQLSMEGLGQFDGTSGVFYKSLPEDVATNPNFAKYDLQMYHYEMGYNQCVTKYSYKP